MVALRRFSTIRVCLLVALGTRACLINPQKDYPIGRPALEAAGSNGSSGTNNSQATAGEAASPESRGGAADHPRDSTAGSDEGGGVAAAAECNQDAECPLGQSCTAASCICVGCKSTGIPNPGGACVAPASAVADGAYGAADVPAQALDGDPATAWSSGDYKGHLSITFNNPEPVSALILLPNASPNSEVSYTILVQGAGATTPKVLSPTWHSSSPDPWLSVQLPEPQLVTKITIDAESSTTWISLFEILLARCE
jgi:hypothetical protein